MGHFLFRKKVTLGWVKVTLVFWLLKCDLAIIMIIVSKRYKWSVKFKTYYD